MKIYLDLLFIQDTIVMCLILISISRVCNIRIKLLRIILSSIISSIISILILVYLPTIYDNLCIKILISYVIVKYSLRLKDNKNIISKTIVFWIITFLTGGALTSFENNILLAFIALVICVLAIRNNLQKQKHLMLLESSICEIKFSHNDKKYKMKALVDTGHNVKTIFGEEVIFIKEKLEDKGGDKKRLVGYKTISGIEKRIGIKIGEIKIRYGNHNTISNAVIVSSPNLSQEYDAIVGYDLIKGGIEDGNNNAYEAKSQEIIS